MKRTLKSFSAIACFTLIAFTSCYLPGSDQYKIKSATADYVSARLNKGEKYQWGKIVSEYDVRSNISSINIYYT